MAFVGRTDVKDPGAQQHQWERLAQRRERLYAEDAQFRDARPDDAVAESVRRPGLRIAEAMATAMTGYADRPALGQRAREVITDPGQWTCVAAITAALRDGQLRRSVVADPGGGSRLASPRRTPAAARGFRVCAGLRQHRLHRRQVGVRPPRRGGGTAADQRAGGTACADPVRDAAANPGCRHRLPDDRGRCGTGRYCAAASYRLRLRAPRRCPAGDVRCRARTVGRRLAERGNSRPRWSNGVRGCHRPRCSSPPTARIRWPGCSTPRGPPGRRKARCSPKASASEHGSRSPTSR